MRSAPSMPPGLAVSLCIFNPPNSLHFHAAADTSQWMFAGVGFWHIRLRSFSRFPIQKYGTNKWYHLQPQNRYVQGPPPGGIRGELTEKNDRTWQHSIALSS